MSAYTQKFPTVLLLFYLLQDLFPFHLTPKKCKKTPGKDFFPPSTSGKTFTLIHLTTANRANTSKPFLQTAIATGSGRQTQHRPSDSDISSNSHTLELNGLVEDIQPF